MNAGSIEHQRGVARAHIEANGNARAGSPRALEDVHECTRRGVAQQSAPSGIVAVFEFDHRHTISLLTYIRPPPGR